MVEKTPSVFVNNFLPICLVRLSRLQRRGRAIPDAPLRKYLALRISAWIIVLGFAALGPGVSRIAAQQQPAAKSTRTSSKKGAATPIAAIKSFRIIQENTGPALEILATHPMVPAIQQIGNPTRLVIDLANARLDTAAKRLDVHSGQITAVRADQFQANPPVARVVVDLVAPRTYTWEAAGNRLVIHLGNNPTDASHSPFQAPTVAGIAPEPQPVVKAIRAAGPLSLASNANSVGSSFSAGADTAVLALSSGGELRVCPGTTLSITPSQNKHNLMLGMSTGALEAHLQLDASSDSVMTPDFRILLVGPGEFHYAFSADTQGNTCVRALPGNTSSAIVTELIGDRTYQVKATDQLVFRAGHLDRVDMNVPLECGCPASQQTIERASSNLPETNSQPSQLTAPAKTDATAPAPSPQIERSVEIPAGNSAPPAAPPPPNELHVQISAPLVFQATGPPPAPVEDVRALPLDARAYPSPQPVAPSPTPAQSRASEASAGGSSTDGCPHGFFHKLGHFFASMFH